MAAAQDIEMKATKEFNPFEHLAGTNSSEGVCPGARVGYCVWSHTHRVVGVAVGSNITFIGDDCDKNAYFDFGEMDINDLFASMTDFSDGKVYIGFENGKLAPHEFSRMDGCEPVFDIRGISQRYCSKMWFGDMEAWYRDYALCSSQLIATLKRSIVGKEMIISSKNESIAVRDREINRLKDDLLNEQINVAGVFWDDMGLKLFKQTRSGGVKKGSGVLHFFVKIPALCFERKLGCYDNKGFCGEKTVWNKSGACSEEKDNRVWDSRPQNCGLSDLLFVYCATGDLTAYNTKEKGVVVYNKEEEVEYKSYDFDVAFRASSKNLEAFGKVARRNYQSKVWQIIQ